MATNKKKFTGLLAEQIELRVENHPDFEKLPGKIQLLAYDLTAREERAKLHLLCGHYGFKSDGLQDYVDERRGAVNERERENRLFYRLLLTLAREHVPGFQEKKTKGRPKK
jgi:hypothetical protein